jgi:hypothetical protein
MLRILAVLGALGLVLLGTYWQWSRPQLYKQCTNATGAWSVSVYRSRGLSVPVKVVVTARGGQIFFSDTIDARDLWRDVEERYPELICEADSARLGPKYWNGQEFGWFHVPVPDPQ